MRLLLTCLREIPGGVSSDLLPRDVNRQRPLGEFGGVCSNRARCLDRRTQCECDLHRALRPVEQQSRC